MRYITAFHHRARFNAIAAVLIAAFATPAFAIDYYVALRLGGGGCKVMMFTPSPAKFKVMGTYPSRAD
ncbi:MAG TPA: hypothetical protein VGN85_09100 [Methyloceanibacter sp.]|nr:hypothetical protein [Methyloceanibacter sp.]